MAYTKQNWTKQTWLKGQKNVENMLNHMEDGIVEGASSEVNISASTQRVEGALTANSINISGTDYNMPEIIPDSALESAKEVGGIAWGDRRGSSLQWDGSEDGKTVVVSNEDPNVKLVKVAEMNTLPIGEGNENYDNYRIVIYKEGGTYYYDTTKLNTMLQSIGDDYNKILGLGAVDGEVTLVFANVTQPSTVSIDLPESYYYTFDVSETGTYFVKKDETTYTQAVYYRTKNYIQGQLVKTTLTDEDGRIRDRYINSVVYVEKNGSLMEYPSKFYVGINFGSKGRLVLEFDPILGCIGSDVPFKEFVPMVIGMIGEINQITSWEDKAMYIQIALGLTSNVYFYKKGTSGLLERKNIIDAGYNPDKEKLIATYLTYDESSGTFTPALDTIEIAVDGSEQLELIEPFKLWWN